MSMGYARESIPDVGLTAGFPNPEPFNRRCRIYLGFHFLLAHYVPPFEHVKDKM